MRPEPVVLRRLAFSPQLTVRRKKIHVSQSSRLGAQISNNGHHSHHQRSREGGGYLRTLAGLGSRVAAVGTSRLLDMERPLACRVVDITG